MSKPMAVTLPCVLLLLDYWPLRRAQCWRNLIFEKVPFFGLSALSCAVTFLAQKHGGAVSSAAAIPVDARIVNAVVAYVSYLGKLFWPCKLAPYYPYSSGHPAWKIALAVGVLFAISTIAWRTRRTRPYFAAGWCIFVGMLVPVIGLIQVGDQAMADRYTYLPTIGIFLLAVWLIAEFVLERQSLVCYFCGGMAIILFACATATFRQIGFWKNSETLFRHTLQVTTNNYIANDLLGNALLQAGKLDEAEPYISAALALKPEFAPALYDSAILLQRRQKYDEAITLIHKAMTNSPGLIFWGHFNLGAIFARQGRHAEAINHYRKGLALRPESPEVLNNLAWLLATNPNESLRDGAEAVRLATHACDLTERTNASMLATLAAAHAEAENFFEAATAQEKVCELAVSQGLSLEIQQQRLESYRARIPFHASR